MKDLASQILIKSGRDLGKTDPEAGLSDGWWFRFRDRHPELSLRQADNLDRQVKLVLTIIVAPYESLLMYQRSVIQNGTIAMSILVVV